ncbi:hypothetical protein P153DRAFT_331890 [Dothidotthia symphoricarpi CBS 119687]|uniref:Uncharacterized protein n=1 Tax=Dothidotthia symphoricarpi CBS 119687 TaxID=1392245 RepID=A0A6A6ANB7_9PLEO|nr:uncharacterized protein P153DRAFT_331890 [Dothidotthia symphoricarpi CBS 119687]KAF2133280.1 hypothetical protein P153DRAFT_331890 [Dothidotthia symphoricarpi CBS 119687]
MALFGRWAPSQKRKPSPCSRQGWRPPALRWWNLVITILICWFFIAVLQYYLHKSQTDGGVIFASNINDLPLRRSFAYLYMPTIIAVIFSIFIVWIDNDAKRFEPYRQMSKPDGAFGKDSLLLQYPFDFMPFVPFTAAKRRHWLVFWASLATFLTTFGIVPLQAGIFANENVTRTFAQTFAVSERFIHSTLQESTLTLSYTHSAYGILNLNETLPPFMTRNYTLAPFTTSTPSSPADDSGTWKANTTLYSMDLECEDVNTVVVTKMSELEDYTSPMTRFNNSVGCSILLGDFNNDTIGSIIDTKSNQLIPLSDDVRYRTFSSFFAGYFVGDRLSTEEIGYSLGRPACNGSFFASFVRNKLSESDPPNNLTAISCRLSYYERDVDATVDVVTKTPLKVVPLGPKRPLSVGLFNSSDFEGTLTTGYHSAGFRSDTLMGNGIPRYLETIDELDLTQLQRWSTGMEFPPMTAMAITTSQRPIEAFLDPLILGEAYANAYRLLFVRAMVDILATDFSTSTREVAGQRVTHVEAVVLTPVFTYLVEGLLGAVSVAAIALLGIGVFRWKSIELKDDPGSVAAVMSMVADSAPLVASFEDLDCSSTSYLQRKLRKRGYLLYTDDACSRITEVTPPIESQQRLLEDSKPESTDDLRVIGPIRPTEFRLITAIPFITLFVVLMILLAILFVKSRPQGLPLPSKNQTVQNLVTEYLPTAIATLIEPTWILINRLLCVLQPLEELRGSKAPASKSISLNYTSLPPQLTIVKAMRARHLVLASVCAMSLLANLLATSFAGLFYQDTTYMFHQTGFPPPYEAQFVSINGSSGPPVDGRPIAASLQYSGAYQGGTGEVQFLVSESNYTRNTSLPSWVDETAMYLPFRAADSTAQLTDGSYRARTKYFTAKPNCKPQVFGQDYELRLFFEIKIPDTAGVSTLCYAPQIVTKEFGESLGQGSRPIVAGDPCPTGRTAAELLTTLIAGRNASKHDWDTCRSAVAVGWMRTTQGNCTHPRKFIPTDFEEASSENTFLMTCQPTISVGDADVHVNGQGVLQSKVSEFSPDADQSADALKKYSTNGLDSLVAQSNLFIFRGRYSGYHNDSFASEYLHYFINRAVGNLSLTDPTGPLPTYADIEKPLERAYARLFAIWLGINQHLLFTPATDTTTQIQGSAITQEERIFFTVPLFIISEVILGIYIIVSIILYLRRPGRYLARMPTSIAAVIALFASSAAVKDLQSTSHMSNKEREKYLNDLDCRYGYGSYVGGDGSVHVGIEKVPYVRYMKETRFEHSRVDREMKRRKEAKKEAETTVEYVPLEDLEGREGETRHAPSSGT